MNATNRLPWIVTAAVAVIFSTALWSCWDSLTDARKRIELARDQADTWRILADEQRKEILQLEQQVEQLQDERLKEQQQP